MQRRLRSLHVFHQPIWKPGARLQAQYTSLETWLLSGLEWDLKQKSALNCLRCWNGESWLESEDLEKCTDLQVLQRAPGIAFHLPLVLQSQMTNRDSTTRWPAFHLCEKGKMLEKSDSMKGYLKMLKCSDLHFAKV